MLLPKTVIVEIQSALIVGSECYTPHEGKGWGGGLGIKTSFSLGAFVRKITGSFCGWQEYNTKDEGPVPGYAVC